MDRPIGMNHWAKRQNGDLERIREMEIVKISEVFETIQGEGLSCGKPSVFLRLANCNLRCRWCDTKHSWDWKHFDYHKEVTEQSVAQLTATIRSYRSRNVVVTGGEPLLQQDGLVLLADALSASHQFEVETAGTLTPCAELTALVTWWNVSPKLENSGNSSKARNRSEPMKTFAGLENVSFKFVIDREEDLDEIKALLAQYDIEQGRVLLMPQAVTELELETRSRWLAELCIAEGFRFGYRLHIALWKGERGT